MIPILLIVYLGTYEIHNRPGMIKHCKWKPRGSRERRWGKELPELRSKEVQSVVPESQTEAEFSKIKPLN